MEPSANIAPVQHASALQREQHQHSRIPYSVHMSQETLSNCPQNYSISHAINTASRPRHLPYHSHPEHHQRNASSNDMMHHNPPPLPLSPSLNVPPQAYTSMPNNDVYSALMTSGYSPHTFYSPIPFPIHVPDGQQQQQQQQQHMPHQMPMYMGQQNPYNLTASTSTPDTQMLIIQHYLQNVNVELIRVSNEYELEKKEHRLCQNALHVSHNDCKQKDRLIDEQTEQITSLQQHLVAAKAQSAKDRVMFESAIEAHASAVQYATQQSHQEMKRMHQEELQAIAHKYALLTQKH
jgi:hypothetical protein